MKGLSLWAMREIPLAWVFGFRVIVGLWEKDNEGGIAGLSAGIYGRLAGYDVDIYEKNPVAGGQCMGWNRKGCHIDNCIHWLTGTKKGTALRQVWETVGALDENTEFVDSDRFYTSIAAGFEVTLWKDLGRTEAELLRLSPEDEAEIKKFIKHVE